MSSSREPIGHIAGREPAVTKGNPMTKLRMTKLRVMRVAIAVGSLAAAVAATGAPFKWA